MQKTPSFRKLLAILVIAFPLIVTLLILGQISQAAPALQLDPTPIPTPNNVQRAVYFNSTVRDEEVCTLALEDDQFVFGKKITNPAMSCPDAFAWKLFSQVITEEFWQKWAADLYTWPKEPFPMCGAESADPGACCQPGDLENPGYRNPGNPALHCPYYPGDHLAVGVGPIIHQGQPLLKSHVSQFEVQITDLDPGRVIRQEMTELVFRNKPMFDYVFSNNLYNREGASQVFAQNDQNQENNSPYRRRDRGNKLATIDFPIDSIMIKSNWLSPEHADALGLTDDPDNPYITMEIDRAVLDDNAPDNQFEPGLYYLVSLHISSKDIPNWVWATFEHVNNPGRCDFTGCNDSFGYDSPDTLAEGLYDNFTQPHMITDNLTIASVVFDTGRPYPGGTRSPALADVFAQLGIGTADQADPKMPGIDDRGWLSYRLKGAQVDFVDSTGRPILLGNSITEGGFVSSSSCMGCHARAAVNAEGEPPLGVFLAQLSEVGYPQAAPFPDPDWYYASSTHPQLQALQTDFVWGFLFMTNTVTSTSSIE